MLDGGSCEKMYTVVWYKVQGGEKKYDGGRGGDSGVGF